MHVSSSYHHRGHTRNDRSGEDEDSRMEQECGGRMLTPESHSARNKHVAYNCTEQFSEYKVFQADCHAVVR